MKVVGLVKNDARINDTVMQTNGMLMSFKAFCVVNLVYSIKNFNQETDIHLASIDQLLLKSDKEINSFLDGFDLIVTYTSKKKPIQDYLVTNQSKVIFIEQPVIHRRVNVELRDQPYVRVMANHQLGTKFISKYSTGSVRKNFILPKKTISRNSNDLILIINQTVGDLAIRPQDPYDWLENSIKKIKEINIDKKICIRDHPLQREEFRNRIDKLLELGVEISKNKFIEDDLKDTYCCITFSSGSAIESIINEDPTIATDKRSFVFEEVSNEINNLKNITRIKKPDINKIYSAMSNTHFSLNEIFDGTCWKIIKNFLC